MSTTLLKRRRIVFTEGFGIHKNPYFKHLPLEGTKGELITIHAPTLKLESILKSSIFVIPMGEDRILWALPMNGLIKQIPNRRSKNRTFRKIGTLIDCEFEVVDQRAGIRPNRGRSPSVSRAASRS